MKLSSEMLQNLPYFWNTKTHVFFFLFSFHATLLFSLMNALVYVNMGKNKLARIENRKNNLHGFSYFKNMANFEAFHWNFSSSKNSEIGRSEIVALFLRSHLLERETFFTSMH